MAVHLTAVTAVAAARNRLAAVDGSRLAAAVVVAMAAVAAVATLVEHAAEQSTAMTTMAAVSTTMAATATVAAMSRDGTVVSAQQGDANHREEDRDAKNQSSIHLGSSKLSKPTRVRNSKTQKHRPPSLRPALLATQRPQHARRFNVNCCPGRFSLPPPAALFSKLLPVAKFESTKQSRVLGYQPAKASQASSLIKCEVWERFIKLLKPE
jgi:hypothetical protein